MRIHYFQHVPFEDLANIKVWAEEKNHRISCSRLFYDDNMPSHDDYDWLIVMGGPMNVYEDKIYPWLSQEKRFIEKAIKENKIILGICLGAQLIADVLGGSVYRNQYKEIGWFPISLTEEAFASQRDYSLPKSFTAFHWHGDTFKIPKDCTRLAESEACENQAFEYNGRVLGLQFHLESSFESVKKLIANCSDELIEEKFIQNPDYILSRSNYFTEINGLMKSFLNHIDNKYSR